MRLVCAVMSLLAAFSTPAWLAKSRSEALKRGMTMSCSEPLDEVPIRARCSISARTASRDGGMRSAGSRSVSEPYSEPE